jgi:transcriptional regulator with XRE-family HTH domain
MPKHPENVQIGQRLRAERVRQGLPLAEVSRFVGVSYQQIQKYETGQDTLSVPMLIKFCRLFGIHPSNICEG